MDAYRTFFRTGWIVFILFVCWTAGAFGESAVLPLSLEEAIAWALNGNRHLAASGLNVQSEEMRARQTKESLRGIEIVPQGAGGMGHDVDEWSAGFGVGKTTSAGTRIAVGSRVRELSPDEGQSMRRGEVTVEVSQPLFQNFGALMQDEAIVAANENVRALRRTWEREKSSLVLRVVDGYEQLIYLSQQLAADEAAAARWERLLWLSKAKERQGRATRTDVLRVELQWGRAQSRIESGKTRLEVQRREFANLLGLPLDSDLLLEAPPLLSLEETPDDVALSIAMEERLDYAQALDQVKTKRRHARMARREVLPDIRVQGRYSRYGEGSDWSDAGDWDEDDWYVGLAADINMNLRSALMGIDVADLNVEAQKAAVVILQYALACEVREKWSAYRLSREELALAEQNRQLAANRAELARMLFANGKASNDSVADAEEDFTQAELVELAARKTASLAAYDVLHTMGILIPAPEELKATISS